MFYSDVCLAYAGAAREPTAKIPAVLDAQKDMRDRQLWFNFSIKPLSATACDTLAENVWWCSFV